MSQVDGDNSHNTTIINFFSTKPKLREIFNSCQIIQISAQVLIDVLSE